MDSLGSRYVWLAMLAGVGASWAVPSYAGVVTTGVATFSADSGGITDSSTTQLTNGVSPQSVYANNGSANGGVSLWTSSNAYSAMAYTQGLGDVKGDASVHWTLALTNNEAVAQHYSYTFVLGASNLSVIRDDSNGVGGNGLASYSVNVSRVGAGTLYSTSASLDQNGVLLTSGAQLANAFMKPAYGLAGLGFGYSWGATTIVLDLGVLKPSESLEIDYDLTYAVSSNFLQFDSEQNSMYGGAATVGFSDPSDFSAVPGLISVLASGGNVGGAVPEPTSLALLAAGLPLLWARRRRVMLF